MTSIVSGGDARSSRSRCLSGLNGKIPWLLNPASVALETKSRRGHWAGEENPLRSRVREMEQRHERAFNERVYLASALFTRPSRAALRIIFLGP